LTIGPIGVVAEMGELPRNADGANMRGLHSIVVAPPTTTRDYRRATPQSSTQYG
jgi:hypothetical protein